MQRKWSDPVHPVRCLVFVELFLRQGLGFPEDFLDRYALLSRDPRAVRELRRDVRDPVALAADLYGDFSPGGLHLDDLALYRLLHHGGSAQAEGARLLEQYALQYGRVPGRAENGNDAVSYTHLRAHETR